MWKIKKEYHYYPSSRNTMQDHYINKGDLISGSDGENINLNYLYSLAEHKYNSNCCSKPKCPDLVFATKEEATEAMSKITLFGDDGEGFYCLSYGEYSRPTLSVQFHYSWQ